MDYQFSHLTERLDTSDSQAWEVHDRALELQRAGEDVVVLSIGDPDFRTPEPIVDNAVSHMRVGRTHYSPALGELNLRRAVADYESRVSPHGCSIDEVAIHPGVTASIFAVMSCLLNSGDGVVIVDPQYVGYAPIMNALNADVTLVTAKADNGFVIDVDTVMSGVRDNTRVIFLNTPANPTGAIIGSETLARLASWCQQNKVWLVCDEVYSMFTYDKPHVSLRTAASSLDYLVVVDGLSKSHAMSGWRVGWSVAPPELTRHIANFSAMSVFGCPQFIQDASAFALNNDEYYVREMREKYRSRRDAVCKQLAASNALHCHKPDAGMFLMIDVRAINEDDNRFATDLLDAEKVSVLPGSAFGEATRGHVRFSLVQPMDVLLEGCSRMIRFAAGQSAS